MNDDAKPEEGGVVDAMPAVAVILINWNGWRDCVECLDALLASNYPRFDVYLVDNDSSDGSVTHIADWCRSPARATSWRRFQGAGAYSMADKPIDHEVIGAGQPVERRSGRGAAPPIVHIVHSGANRGFAGGNNVGIRCAGFQDYDFFWLLNTDTVVHQDAMRLLVERARQSARIGIVGSTLRYYSEPEKIQAMGGATLDRARFLARHIGVGKSIAELPAEPSAVEAAMTYVVGASMLVRREFVEQIGLMQEDYFLYYEEMDWALRGEGRFTLGYAPGSMVFHKVGQSSAKSAPWFSVRLMYRNRIKVVARFMPDLAWSALRRMALEAGILLLKGNLRHARAIGAALLQYRTLLREGKEGGVRVDVGNV